MFNNNLYQKLFVSLREEEERRLAEKRREEEEIKRYTTFALKTMKRSNLLYFPRLIPQSYRSMKLKSLVYQLINCSGMQSKRGGNWI